MAEGLVVVAYNPAWPDVFSTIKRSLAPALEGLAVSIEHVGSTSVPGLAAKPIIDLDVVVTTSTDVDAAIEELERCGYEHEGDLGVPGRHAFRQPTGLPAHHLYVVVKGNQAHRDHIDFRDHLRRHPGDAVRYAARKEQLKGLLARDRAAYADAKRDVVEHILHEARANAVRPTRADRP